METYKNILLISALVALAILTLAYIIRTIVGPKFFDRILGANNISTLIINMICILAIILNESYIEDIAIIYAMLGFVTIVIASKLYLKSYSVDRDDDLSTLKRRKNND